MILTFDLDGVICSEEKTFERSLAVPIPGVKESLKKLHEDGHTIVIESARSWAEYRMTEKWLKDHEIYYDVLLLGKPISDLRVDDKAIRFHDWDSVLQFVEGIKRGYPAQFPSDEYFLKENRRIIFEFLQDIAKRELQEPVLEIGPMEGRGNPVVDRFPEFYVDTRRLFGNLDFRTLSPVGDVDYHGSVTKLSETLQRDSIGTIIMMSVLEHVAQPWWVPVETFQVLKPGGMLFLQIPWNLRYHGPSPDCWRISDEGLRALFGPYFDFVELEQVQTPDRALMPICLKAALRVRK